LTAKAASQDTPELARNAARLAIVRLTGRPFESQERTPVQVLADAAWQFHRHQVDLGEEPVVLWAWDKERNVPAHREVPVSEAEAIHGLRFAHDALRLSPGDRSAQLARLSLTIEKAIEKAGFTSVLSQDQATLNAAKAAGATRLSEVLKIAIADGKYDLGAVAATALGAVIDRNTLAITGRPHPLVDALYAPGRRLQFAAAKAIVELAPTEIFPGASRVVPTLARFLNNQPLPRSVVIDANPNRGSQLAGFLIELGYDSELEQTGHLGFLAATGSADVEVILLSYDLFGQGWALRDTIANLRADSRTAAIPIFIYGPLNVQYRHPNLVLDYPGIKFLVQPGDAALLKQQFKELPIALKEPERADYARNATKLLAQIAKDRNGPFATDLSSAEAGLSVALKKADSRANAATALGGLPNVDAQRSLANVALDPSRAVEERRQAAAELIRSIKRFGPLMSANQEARLKSMVREEGESDLGASLEAVVSALRPAKARIGSTKR
jgi:hypothetical protein